jgi:hypothetical protein
VIQGGFYDHISYRYWTGRRNLSWDFSQELKYISSKVGLMKIFILSTFILGFVAMNAKGTTGYATNNGMNSPGTFDSKSTSASTSSEKAARQIPSGQNEVGPESMNSSPNPAPTKDQMDDSAYGDTVVKPYKQSQEARPQQKIRTNR